MDEILRYYEIFCRSDFVRKFLVSDTLTAEKGRCEDTNLTPSVNPCEINETMTVK